MKKFLLLLLFSFGLSIYSSTIAASTNLNMTAGNAYGYTGYYESWIGSLSPSIYNGSNIIGLYSYNNIFTLHISGNIPQNSFQDITISGYGVFASASASYSYASGSNTTSWVWNGGANLIGGNSYTISIDDNVVTIPSSTNCSENPTISNSTGFKFIPTGDTHRLHPANDNVFTCESHYYYSGDWSAYLSKGTHHDCGDNRYVSELRCYDSSNVEQACSGSSWSRYRTYCKRRDTTPPTGVVTYTPSGWTISDVTVSIACSDVGSGCQMNPISGWNIVGNTYSRIISSNTSGNIILTDSSGNSSVPVDYNVSNIDRTVPGSPIITATDGRDSDIWSDISTALNSTPNDSGELSPRFNQYCKDDGVYCIMEDMLSDTIPGTSSLGEGIHTYRVRTCTTAGNCTAQSGEAEFILKIDTTAPTSGDLSIVPSASVPLLANDTQNFQVTGVSSSGSPIVSITGEFEDYSNPSNYISYPASTGNILSITPSIEDVDSDSLLGSRQYSFHITRIEDAAGNVSTGSPLQAFNHSVYANTSSSTSAIMSVTANGLNNGSNIADGTDKNLIITLRDEYGNNIIPAPTINRNINFNFNVNNNLYLNQYTRSGGSSIFTDASAWQIGDNINRSFLGANSTNGTYEFLFRAYTPTYQYPASDPNGNFDINNIQTSITGSIGARPNINITNANIISNFAPLYTTDFGGEIVNNGFIEGATQSSTLSLFGPTYPGEIYLQYGGEVDRLRLDFVNGNGVPTPSVYETSPSTLLLPPYSFNTRLEQEGGSINDVSKTFLSSHLSYTLDGYNIFYNGGVIGKDNYFDTEINSNTNQSGIKIIGISSSSSTGSLTSSQFPDDVSILGSITKSTSRKDIQSSVYSVIKNITPVNGSNRILNLYGDDWSSNSDGTKLRDASVLYFKNLDTSSSSIRNFELGNGSNQTIEGKKTLIIEGGNLYIRSNMMYGDLSDDILGIVVLKDEQGRGGNLYINPSVTDIHANIYVDKSVISFDGIQELDGNTPASGLANQLYIYGSIFSENTIGGSRKLTPECPYYVSICNNTVQAQKYDLNYLRRYILVDHDGDSDLPAPYVSTPNIPAYGGNPSLGGALYGTYPVVIKYNPMMQSTPPPLFQ